MISGRREDNRLPSLIQWLIPLVTIWCVLGSSNAELAFDVIGTTYDPSMKGSLEVALPDVFLKFGNLGWASQFDDSSWYPGPDRERWVGGRLFRWHSSFDFSQHKKKFKDFYLNRDFRVRVIYRGRSVIAPIKDVGPWNLQDNYWDAATYSDVSRRRRLHADLAQGYPQAFAAWWDDYNDGRDEAGRKTNGAGIDLSAEVAKALNFPGKDWVRVEFLWPITLELAADTVITPTFFPGTSGPGKTVDSPDVIQVLSTPRPGNIRLTADFKAGEQEVRVFFCVVLPQGIGAGMGTRKFFLFLDPDTGMLSSAAEETPLVPDRLIIPELKGLPIFGSVTVLDQRIDSIFGIPDIAVADLHEGEYKIVLEFKDAETEDVVTTSTVTFKVTKD